MSTKLTLLIDEFVIKDAKDYALKTGRSVSQLVESYLKAITSTTKKKKSGLPPYLKRWHAAFKTGDNTGIIDMEIETIGNNHNP